MQRKLSYNFVKYYFSLFLQKETIENDFIQLKVYNLEKLLKKTYIYYQIFFKLLFLLSKWIFKNTITI
jgi:hypothetical protein